ncbi:hypothetical protein KIPB_012887, partial [Kipferlia bialata]|eukprot:g12887.t1
MKLPGRHRDISSRLGCYFVTRSFSGTVAADLIVTQIPGETVSFNSMVYSQGKLYMLLEALGVNDPRQRRWQLGLDYGPMTHASVAVLSLDTLDCTIHAPIQLPCPEGLYPACSFVLGHTWYIVGSSVPGEHVILTYDTQSREWGRVGGGVPIVGGIDSCAVVGETAYLISSESRRMVAYGEREGFGEVTEVPRMGDIWNATVIGRHIFIVDAQDSDLPVYPYSYSTVSGEWTQYPSTTLAEEEEVDDEGQERYLVGH